MAGLTAHADASSAPHGGKKFRRGFGGLHREVVAAQVDEHEVEAVPVAVDGLPRHQGTNGVHGDRLLVADEANESLTIPVIAARAGVHATTVYRRWGTVGELLADVMASRFSGEIVVPDTGGLRGDLERYAYDLAKDLGDPDTLALVRATIGTGGEQGAAACRGERQRQLEAILEREQARGGQPPTIEHTTDAVLAPSTTGPSSPTYP